MPPALLKLIGVAFAGPFLLRISEGRKLNTYQRRSLRVIGYVSIGYNLYGLLQAYRAGKLDVQNIATPG